MRFAFIDAWKEEWSVEFLCRVMQVTSRGFRAWRKRPMSQRQRDDMVLLAHIREQHRLSLQSYSRPRITALGRKIGHRSIARSMRENDIKIVRTQKYKPGLTATTRSTSCPTCWIKISLQTDQTKSGLATYPISGPVKAGCTWPSLVICAHSGSSDGPFSGMLRKPCWAVVSNRMQQDLAMRALDMAVALRQPPEGCIHHTNRGS